MRTYFSLFLAMFSLAAVACASQAVPTQAPLPTYTPAPTYTPFPTYTPPPVAEPTTVSASGSANPSSSIPSVNPVPTPATSLAATATIQPTELPQIIPAPVPTSTPLPVPTSVPTPTPDHRVALLEQEALEWGNAMVNHDWKTLFSFQNSAFQNSCPIEEFIPFMTLYNAYNPQGIPKGARYVLDDVKIEGDLAWVYSHFETNSDPIYHDEDEYSVDEPPENIWVDGEWVFYTPESESDQGSSSDRPCDLALFRGFVIEVPAPAGTALVHENGAHITVTNIINNAWPIIQRNSEYADPPEQGNRYYMLTLEVAYPSGVGSITTGESDFNLVGADRVTYDSYEHSCGWQIPELLGGEIYAGGTIRGNICFEVKTREQGFILIYSPGYDGYPLYLSLE